MGRIRWQGRSGQIWGIQLFDDREGVKAKGVILDSLEKQIRAVQ
jgi:hypothetical protein